MVLNLNMTGLTDVTGSLWVAGAYYQTSGQEMVVCLSIFLAVKFLQLFFSWLSSSYCFPSACQIF